MGTGVHLQPEPTAGKISEVAKKVVMGLLNIIEEHKRIVLASPFVVAAILWVAYAFGGTEVRQVLDFMSPGHFVGR